MKIPNFKVLLSNEIAESIVPIRLSNIEGKQGPSSLSANAGQSSAVTTRYSFASLPCVGW